MTGHAPRAIAVICQGAAILAGASPVEAARVWEVIGPMDVPQDPGAFAVIVRGALSAIRGEGQGDGGGDSPPVGSWFRGPGGTLFLRVGWHDSGLGIRTGWHRRGWGLIEGDPPGFPAGYEPITAGDALGTG